MFLADRGLMKVTVHPAGGYKPMLPLDRDFKDCRGDNRTIFCFKAGQLNSFYARQLYRQVLLRARISYGNSVCLSVRLSVTTRYRTKPR